MLVLLQIVVGRAIRYPLGRDNPIAHQCFEDMELIALLKTTTRIGLQRPGKRTIVNAEQLEILPNLLALPKF
jgi:hypothetical protein